MDWSASELLILLEKMFGSLIGGKGKDESTAAVGKVSERGKGQSRWKGQPGSHEGSNCFQMLKGEEWG